MCLVILIRWLLYYFFSIFYIVYICNYNIFKMNCWYLGNEIINEEMYIGGLLQILGKILWKGVGRRMGERKENRCQIRDSKELKEESEVFFVGYFFEVLIRFQRWRIIFIVKIGIEVRIKEICDYLVGLSLNLVFLIMSCLFIFYRRVFWRKEGECREIG